MFRKLKKKTKAARGFSLGELLTAIGIITILISFLLPALAKARDKARSSV